MTETPTKSEAVIRDSMKITPLRLDEASVKGLYPIQIEAMRECAIDVNQAMSVAGNATRSAMARLYQLKKDVKHNNWTAFIKSGVLSVSAKMAADYVNAYGKWLMNDADVPDLVIGSLSARSLVAIANSEATTRTLVKAKILAGATSENDIRKVINEAGGKKKLDKKKKRMEELDVEASKNESDSKENLLKTVNVLQRELKEKKAENAKLKEQIAKLEEELEFTKAG